MILLPVLFVLIHNFQEYLGPSRFETMAIAELIND
jgi:hypothetical protein